MQVVMVMFRGDGERRSFSITRDLTVIGRREDCDLRIPVGDVSRKHCRLVKDDDTIRVEDLGSSNGTHVNGERVQEAILNAGDLIQVGPVQFIIQIDGVPSEEELTRPPAPASEDTATGAEVVASEEMSENTSGEAAETQEIADLTELEEVSAGAEELDEAALEEVPAEEISATELEEVEEVAAAPVAKRPPAPPTSKPSAAVEKTKAVEATPPVEEPAAEDDWNFIDTEAEPNQSHVDFNIDMGTSHDQPHV